MGKSEIQRMLLNILWTVCWVSDITETTDSVLTAPNLMFWLGKNWDRATENWAQNTLMEKKGQKEENEKQRDGKPDI